MNARRTRIRKAIKANAANGFSTNAIAIDVCSGVMQVM